jgi:hypothetical protein
MSEDLGFGVVAWLPFGFLVGCWQLSNVSVVGTSGFESLDQGAVSG